MAGKQGIQHLIIVINHSPKVHVSAVHSYKVYNEDREHITVIYSSSLSKTSIR